MERQLAPKAVARFACPASQFQFPVRTKPAPMAWICACRNIQIAECFPSRGNAKMSLPAQSLLSPTRKRIEANRLVDQSPDHCLARHLTHKCGVTPGEDHDSHVDSCRLYSHCCGAGRQRSESVLDRYAEDTGTQHVGSCLPL
jgi:hypothetical protein